MSRIVSPSVGSSDPAGTRMTSGSKENNGVDTAGSFRYDAHRTRVCVGGVPTAMNLLCW
jgi:hypothetical protein